MKISLNRLKTVLNDNSINPTDLSSKLTFAGFEVDSLEEKIQDNETDVILDINTTANRGDALSVIGMSREVAALYNIKFQLPVAKENFAQECENEIRMSNVNGCRFYRITLIKNINMQPTPQWVKSYLSNLDIESHNFIEDILRYILIEYGQPIMAFDALKVSELTHSKENNSFLVEVHSNHNQKKFYGRNSQEFSIDQNNLITFINNYPISISGIIGSEATAISSSTSSVILETAVFDPHTVRKSSGSLNIKTEESIRFERGLDCNLVNIAHEKTVQLIKEINKGTVVSSSYKKLCVETKIITLSLKNIQYLLGDKNIAPLLTRNKVKTILTQLGFALDTTSEGWLVEVPEHRLTDIELEQDLIEEIGRIYGFNNFDAVAPSPDIFPLFSTHDQFVKQIKSFLLAKGFSEILHHSFGSSNNSMNSIKIINPLNQEQNSLRKTLLASLIDTIIYNYNQGNGYFNAFEISRIFSTINCILLEKNSLAAIFGSHLIKENWSTKSRFMTWFEAKGIVENLFRLIKIKIQWTKQIFPSSEHSLLLHSQHWATISMGEKNIGIFGEIHPNITKKNNFSGKLYSFELDLDAMGTLCKNFKYSQYIFQPYSVYPIISRDINLKLPIKVNIQEILETIYSINNPVLNAVDLLDDYRPSSLAGQRSLLFRLSYRSLKKTLTVGEVDKATEEVQQSLKQKFPILTE